MLYPCEAKARQGSSQAEEDEHLEHGVLAQAEAR